MSGPYGLCLQSNPYEGCSSAERPLLRVLVPEGREERPLRGVLAERPVRGCSSSKGVQSHPYGGCLQSDLYEGCSSPKGVQSAPYGW